MAISFVEGSSTTAAAYKEIAHRLIARACGPRDTFCRWAVNTWLASPAMPVHQGVRMTMTSSTYDVISSDRVEGTKVYNAAGEKLGSIDDLMIDKKSGQVRYAVLEFGGFLGMGTDRYPIPWSMLNFDTEKDGYVVPLDKAMLEGAPRYADDAKVPNYDDAYSSSVDKYYGL